MWNFGVYTAHNKNIINEYAVETLGHQIIIYNHVSKAFWEVVLMHFNV